METMYSDCCGLDVHKEDVWACVRHLEGGKVRQQVRRFGTHTSQLLALGDWLAEERVSHVAMESTGVYWKPVYNLLEDRFTTMVVNAREIKQVPGRKTDVADCQWIAQLLQHGLLRASFVPDRPQRELRDLTRQRVQLISERARVVNRVQKILEDANIKLASVASDVMGVSGRKLLQSIIAGQNDATALAELAHRRMRSKIPQLREALWGRVTEHHRFMLRMLLDQIEHLEKQIRAFDDRIDEALGPFEREAVERLDTIPGVDHRAAQNIIAEIGADMSHFPSERHLCSWAGLSPGNHLSAGKRKRGRMTDGNRWLKRTLTQTAWAATRTKDTYLSAQYRRLAGKRGRKRAVMAVAHSQLASAYWLLSRATDYVDLGASHFDKLNGERRKHYLLAQLKRLGYEVALTPAA